MQVCKVCLCLSCVVLLLGWEHVDIDNEMFAVWLSVLWCELYGYSVNVGQVKETGDITS